MISFRRKGREIFRRREEIDKSYAGFGIVPARFISFSRWIKRSHASSGFSGIVLLVAPDELDGILENGFVFLSCAEDGHFYGFGEFIVQINL